MNLIELLDRFPDEQACRDQLGRRVRLPAPSAGLLVKHISIRTAGTLASYTSVLPVVSNSRFVLAQSLKIAP